MLSYGGGGGELRYLDFDWVVAKTEAETLSRKWWYCGYKVLAFPFPCTPQIGGLSKSLNLSLDTTMLATMATIRASWWRNWIIKLSRRRGSPVVVVVVVVVMLAPPLRKEVTIGQANEDICATVSVWVVSTYQCGCWYMANGIWL